ncbi:MAG: S-layer homology domain-containing protein [Tissierellaceae bacterium]
MKNKVLRVLLQILILAALGGILTSLLIQYTFATNIDKEANVIITINSDGSITQEGSLFRGQLYPATVEDAEKGIGGIHGIIRVNNQFKSMSIENIAIGLKDFIIRNGYPEQNVYNSFIRNVNLKVEKGFLLVFNKTIIDYTRLEDILYEKDNEEHRGYVLKDKLSLARGDRVDLKYTLHMAAETGDELEAITVSMPIYLNLAENISEVEEKDPAPGGKVAYNAAGILGLQGEPEENEFNPALNKEDHIQYIQGYPDNTVRPEGLITREEAAAVFYRLLDDDYRQSILTTKQKFPDVKSSRWSAKHISTLANGNIVSGYPDGNFRPGGHITRAELATISSKFDKLSTDSGDSFADISSHWANKYINSAAKKGWVKGYPDGTFRPDQYITRAEFVTLVNSVLARRVKKENILPGIREFPDLSPNMWHYENMVEAINSHTYIRLEDSYEEWIEIYYPQLDM